MIRKRAVLHREGFKVGDVDEMTLPPRSRRARGALKSLPVVLRVTLRGRYRVVLARDLYAGRLVQWSIGVQAGRRALAMSFTGYITHAEDMDREQCELRLMPSGPVTFS